MDKLVSIITPTYNCGKYIHRLLDSVLSQTYKNIEMFVIDDGSTDNTKEIVEPYIEKFVNVGKKLQYLRQENGGAASAINTGLKYIEGEYLVWPDADDWYAVDDAIEQLVHTFENSSTDVGFVRGFQHIIDENTLNITGKNGDENREYHDNLLEQSLGISDNTEQWWWPPGGYMIKTEHLFDNYTDKNIFYSDTLNGGQNFQLLLPILYNYKCVTIKKFIYNILYRACSHSNKKRYYGEARKRLDTLENIVANTLLLTKNMPNHEKTQYNNRSSMRYIALKFVLAFGYKRRKDCREYYSKILSENRNEANKYKLKYLFSQMPFGFIVYRYGSFAVNLAKRTIKFLKTEENTKPYDE
jgi:glycosyltransferase involved in cell wall biosynthesis